MKIRIAEEKDIPRAQELLSQVLEIHAAIRPDIFISGTTKYTAEELLAIFNDPQRPVFAAADDDDTMIGYAFCKVMDLSGRNNMKDSRTLYIDDLCVDENCRGMHVGRALFDHVRAYAEENGFDTITLNVWEGNDSAEAFYRKCGFRVKKKEMDFRIG